MSDAVKQRRDKLVMELTRAEQECQQAQAIVQQRAVQAERLRGAIALCDELLREADQPEVA